MIHSSKLPHIGTTIFTVMSKLAQDYNAINLAQGFPDFEPDDGLLDRVNHHLRNGKNQYPPMIGVSALRDAIAQKLNRTQGVQIDSETEITITSGATEALFCAIQSLIHPGDEVIIFDPAYDSYEPAIVLAGGTAIRIPLLLPNYAIDWHTLQQKLNDRVRLIIINSPHNPTGSILCTQDLDRLAAAIRSFHCVVLSDEVYEHIIFDEQTHASVLTHEELRQKSLAVFSFGKTYHATGWKVGYCIAPPTFTAEFRKIHQFNVFTTCTPMQWALADFVADSPAHYVTLGNFYQQKRDLFVSLLKQSRFKLLPARGTYFQLADYRAISDKKDTEFANWLTTEKGVAVIPLSPFHKHPPDTRIVRFCFAKQDATLRQAAEILSLV